MSGHSSELRGCSATELTRRIRSRDISPVELMEYVIRQIEERNPSINGFVVFGFEEARERARQAERALMANETLGALHGLPIAMKDCGESKRGWLSTFGGIRALKSNVSEYDSVFPERMEAAGAIIVGKTNAPSFGFRGLTDNYLFGPSCNPFNIKKNTGGSSGGSAAVVADGLLSLAEGGDGGGSIRIPASWCGVYGYKPSFGRVPGIFRPNVFGGTAPFIFDGPITRTVEDAALALSVLSGYDSRDPFSLESKVDALNATRQPISGWKIAYSRDFGVFPVDPEVVRVTEQALSSLEQAGAHVEEVSLAIGRSQEELSDAWFRLAAQNVLLGLDTLAEQGINILRDHPDDLPAEVHRWCEIAKAMSAQDYLRCQLIRSEIYEVIRAVLDEYRILVTPTVACLPVDNARDGNTVGPSEINGERVDPIIGWCMTYLINFTGHPAASVPAGLSGDNLPIGLQIVGRRYADDDVLAVSAAVERHRPWTETYRICAERLLTPSTWEIVEC